MIDIVIFFNTKPKLGVFFIFLCCMLISFSIAELTGMQIAEYKLEKTVESLIMLIIHALTTVIFMFLTICAILSLFGVTTLEFC